jgi:hypothetical protein
MKICQHVEGDSLSESESPALRNGAGSEVSGSESAAARSSNADWTVGLCEKICEMCGKYKGVSECVCERDAYMRANMTFLPRERECVCA